MNKHDILEVLNNFSYEWHEYWLVMGSALVLHGIKETTDDIDIGCSAKLFNQLEMEGYKPVLSRTGKPRIDFGENCHFYLEWKADIDSIEGVQVADLQSVVADKQRFRRKKDIDDIVLIHRYLEGKNGTSN